jgi:hypothetical protein
VKRLIANCIVICWVLIAIAPTASAQHACDKCDCVHLPCPKECKPCCGMSEGVITSKNHSRLTLSDDTEFKVTATTQINGRLSAGTKARVYFRKSGDEKVATRIMAISGGDSVKKD